MANRRVQYTGNLDYYVRKLEKVIDRFGATDMNYGLGREEAWVEFRLGGDLYRFDHSLQKAEAHGFSVSRATDCFAQIVLALEDLARLSERGIYKLQTWLSGLKALPPVVQVPSFLEQMGFQEIPADFEDVKARYKTLARQMHPDGGGNQDDFLALNGAMEQANRFYAKGGV